MKPSPIHRHFVLYPVSLASRDQADGGAPTGRSLSRLYLRSQGKIVVREHFRMRRFSNDWRSAWAKVITLNRRHSYSWAISTWVKITNKLVFKFNRNLGNRYFLKMYVGTFVNDSFYNIRCLVMFIIAFFLLFLITLKHSQSHLHTLFDKFIKTRRLNVTNAKHSIRSKFPLE